MNLKKLPIRLLLLLLALACVLPAMVSCKKKKNEGSSDDYTGEYLDDLGEFDFDNQTFKVLSVESKEGTYTLFDIKEETSDPVDAAVYKRNRIIESRFNIVLDGHTEKQYSTCFEKLRTEALAPTEGWDLVMLINRDAYTAIQENIICTPKDLKYIDMSKDYYLRDVNDALTIDGVSLFAYSDESIYTFERAACIAFNKKMIEDEGMDNPYELVESGEWTYEQMFEMIADGTKVDSEGKASVYGMIGCTDYTGVSFWLGCGQKLITTNAAKTKLEFKIDKNTEIINITNAMRTLMDNGNLKLEYNRGTTDAPWVDPFTTQGALFQSNVVGKLMLLRNVETFDYGVVPYPMLNKEQDEYYSRVVDAWLHVVPKTCPDIDRASVILEALASGSSQYVFPAYYDKVLKYSILRDKESIEMLEIIRAHRVFDLADVTWHATIRYNLDNEVFVDNPKYNVVEFAQTYRTQLNPKIDAMLQMVAAMKES